MSNLYVMKKPGSDQYWTRAGVWGYSFEAQVFEEAPGWNNAEAVEMEADLLRELLTSDLTLTSTYVPQIVAPCAKYHLPSFKWEVALRRGTADVYVGPYGQGVAYVDGPFPGTLARTGGGFSLYTWAQVATLYKEGSTEVETHPRDEGKVFAQRVTCKARPPALLDVLYCTLADASALDYPTFESWASEYGYDTDSRKAEGIYRTCLREAAVLNAALGLRVHDLRIAFQNY